MKSNFIISFFCLILVSVISSALLSSVTEGKAVRTTLLNSLERYKTSQAPLCEPVEAVGNRLYEFSPHFVTPDAELNQVLFSLLNDHFRESRTINDPTVHDELELMTLKIFFESELFTSYNPIILQYVLCYFHEIMYYLNGMAPSSLEDAKVKLVRKLHKYNLPKSYEYLINSEHPGILSFPEMGEIENDLWTLSKWRDTLRFFCNRPTFDEIIAYVQDRNNLLSSEFVKPAEFEVMILERVYPFIPSEELLLGLISSARQTVFSPEMFHWYKSMKNNEISLPKSLPGMNDLRLKYAYFKVIKDSLEADDGLHEPLSFVLRIYGCDYTKRFSLSFLKGESNPNTINQLFKDMCELLHSKSFTLAQLEMFSDLVSSDLFSTEQIQKLREGCIRNNQPILLNIIEYESNRLN